MQSLFETEYEAWLSKNIQEEENPRRRERLEVGLGHGTVEFLRTVWFPSSATLNICIPSGK